MMLVRARCSPQVIVRAKEFFADGRWQIKLSVWPDEQPVVEFIEDKSVFPTELLLTKVTMLS